MLIEALKDSKRDQVWNIAGRAIIHDDIVAMATSWPVLFEAGGAVVSTAGRSEVQFPEPFCVQFVYSACLCVQRHAHAVD